MNFQNELIKWYLYNKRALPWRETTDAYVIWISEIIMQQTRVEQGLPYFNKFLAAFPTVEAFARASETEVLKLWQGLGYYSRGRNMLKTAQDVVQTHGGRFPTAYQDLIKLKGVGPYTAAAISSFSSNENRAVVDGNVYRVLSRYFGISTPINSSQGIKAFQQLAQELTAGQEAAIYNQAIMEFGALQCKPRQPACDTCPLQTGCYAYKHQLTASLPVKMKGREKRVRHFNYFLCQNDNGAVLVKRRPAGDIWQGLYDLPLIETADNFTSDVSFRTRFHDLFGKDASLTYLKEMRHLLTHQTIFVQFFVLDNYIINFNQNADIKWVSTEEFHHLPLPKVIHDFMTEVIKRANY
ncbi:A/G-specific adenine glycosylase [Pedobacter faecalis]|uniref:A/G-specific adenine glycosylase n=1 Tax=Pedobacter faecalis TaxID=3041495 RepID=UPI00254C2735|nr:A/G-specific adenine glycosylase [Pedobacter sp. ELA7]